ncbi:MAG TPA: NAD(P)-binding domain-containing protein [Longimicrobium sp.]|nr:NAD(P)-binding domain-containing protein [Longimicrobium sp.]
METSAADRGALPVAVIGAGPIGLAAAAHLVARGETPVVLEAGDSVGAAIRGWSHVRLFSPWKYLVDPVARGMLEAAGWTAPDGDRLPTGGELVEGLLEPLAALPAIAPHLRTGRRVVAVTRRGFDKVKSAGRERAPFELVVRTAEGRTERILARAVIDASGTYGSPNPIGAGGLPVEGETELAGRIHYGIPDVLGSDRARHAGRRTLVVGSGHSAFNALLDLAALAREAPGTEVVWAIRRREPGQMFGGGERDALPARGSLGARLRSLVDRGEVTLVTGFRTVRLVETERGIVVEGEDDAVIGPVDRLVVATGFRPDVGMLRELRTGLDPWLEAPVALAPLIDPNVHSCGTVYPHGFAELSHPEPDFYVVGMKSYGRAPTFLLLTGYEQVRSVAAALAGDLESARAVELVLPETGVCSTSLAGSGCCSVEDDAGVTREPVAASCGIASGCASPASRGALPVLAGASSGGCCG